MQLNVYIPKGILKNVVENITYLHDSGTGIALQRMYQVIIINMGTNFRVAPVYTSNQPPTEHTDTIWINGKQEIPLVIENPGTTAMYVVGIKAGMLPYLANLPALETNELAVGAHHWTSGEIYNLREQLLACPDIHSGFLLIEEYLTRLLVKKDVSNMEKIKWMDKAIHTCSVSEICRQLGVTRKSLRAETQYYFGDAVKNIQGIIRFNHTLSAIAQHPHQSLSSLHLYYDQSHFINDFKARSGITPMQYKKLCRQFPHIKHTPNFIPLQKETFLQFITAGD
jgi:AraC-like DNA-binding protein